MANITQINGYAISSSNSGGGGSSFPYTGSAIISGSLIVTGSTTSTLGFTGSLFGTSSWANNVISASYAVTASRLNASNTSIFAASSNRMVITASNGIIMNAGDIGVSLESGITITGNVLPGPPITNNTSSWSLGSPTLAWKDLYVSNGSVYFISGSNTASISFTNGAINFGTSPVIIPTGSTVPTASFATNAANAVNATNANKVFVSDSLPSTNNWSIPIIEGAGGDNSLLHAVGPTYDPTTGYFFPAKGEFSGPVTASGFNGTISNAVTASYINNGSSFAGPGSTITGSTAISASYGLLVPANTFKVGDIIKIQGVFLKPNAATNTAHYIYANTSNQLSGATQMAIFNSTTFRWTPITRTFGIESSTRTVGYAAATSNYSDDIPIATGFATSSLNINWGVDQYILFAALNATLADRTDSFRFYAKKI